MADLANSRSHLKRQLEALRTAPTGARRDLVRKILRDRRLHLAYAYDAVRRSRGLQRSTPDGIAALASSFNAFAPINEAVLERTVDKGSGRRVVHDFGPRRRMHQALVADILRLLHPPPRTQTLFNGGMPAALRAVEAAYRDGGMTHGVEVDFVGFYNSVTHTRLAGLLRPLPSSVVDHVVWDLAMREAPIGDAAGIDTVPPTSSFPTGLSLGSGASPIVGECIVSKLLAVAQLPDTITYADNLFVMGRTEAEVRSRVQSLVDSAASLDVGRLELREGYSVSYDLSRGFEFLKREGTDRGQGIEWSPGQAKLNQYMISATDRRLEPPEIAKVEARIRHWRRAYKGWPGGNALEAEFLAALAARRYYTNSNASNLTAAIHAVVIAYAAGGELRCLEDYVPTEGDTQGRLRTALLFEVRAWIEEAQGLARTI